MKKVSRQFSVTSTSNTAPDVIFTLPQASGATVMGITAYNTGTSTTTLYLLVQETDMSGNVVNYYVVDQFTLYPGQQVYVSMDDGLYDLPPGSRLAGYLDIASTVNGTVKFVVKP